MAIIEAHNLDTGYRDRNGKPKMLHKNICFNIPAGQRLLITGRNGIGKSTFIKTLAGLIPPLAGSFSIDGTALTSLSISDIAEYISIAFSTPPELPMMRSQEVLLTAIQKKLSPFSFSIKKELEQAKHFMSICGIGHLYNCEFEKLSDGEKQKVMLSRCLMQQTPVILLDEPLAFLDYPSRLEFLKLLEELSHGQGKSIIFTSHDLEISLANCDRLLVLKSNGQWSFNENISEIKSLMPAHLFHEN